MGKPKRSSVILDEVKKYQLKNKKIKLLIYGNRNQFYILRELIEDSGGTTVIYPKQADLVITNDMIGMQSSRRGISQMKQYE